MPLIDLSHPMEHGMTTYKGLPGPVIMDHMSRTDSRDHYAPGTEFHIGRIEMVANTGTYIDAPFHRLPQGVDIAALPLSSLANLPVTLLRRAHNAPRAIGPEAFADLPLGGHAVLIHTSHDRHWSTDAYFQDHPFLTRTAAELLRDQGVTLVGIDSLNIDSTTDPQRPVHTILLTAQIPIVEHLTNLAALPDTSARFFAVPAPVRAIGSFPVRAFAFTP